VRLAMEPLESLVSLLGGDGGGSGKGTGGVEVDVEEGILRGLGIFGGRGGNRGPLVAGRGFLPRVERLGVSTTVS
jgi:hypothetical protein